MARTRKFDFDKAIDVVMNEIWLNGYKGSSVKRLSEVLGITRSSFYNAFGSREHAFELALQRYSADAPTSKLMALTPNTPFKSALTKILYEVCQRRIQEQDQRGCMMSNSLAELSGMDNKARCIVEEMTLNGLGRYKELVSWAVESGELSQSTNISGLAMAIQSLMIGINTQSKVVKDQQQLWLSASTTLKALGLFSESDSLY